ncbi:MAG: tripartite tricarboxylate transporter substrate binding protein [Burkholderiales bacterium]|nr:tripartite tricarboxylate transporter substrate binding protein [Burkholderiales bacterium]
MRKPLLRIAFAAAALFSAVAYSSAARADYPERAVKVIVPYSPGGPADLLARYVAQKLATSLGQSFVIENKPGAGLVIGADLAANSPPDGYTLFVGASSMLMDSGARGRKPEDNLRDFAPISLIASLPLVVVTSQALPVKNVRELIDYARKHPNDVNFGSSGNGSLTHLAGEVFNYMADVKMVHVPYRGINEAMNDLIGNRVQVSFAGAPIALPHAKTGKVRALAVTGATRASSAPELPTVAEAALPGYDVNPWYGFLAPAATPPAVLNKLHAEIARIMQGADVKERWLGWGAEPAFSKQPAEFGALMRAETDKWARLRREGRIKLD